MELGTVIASILWGTLAVSVVLRLRRPGAEDFRPPITAAKHRLVGSAALYLATPAAVLASQALQVLLYTLSGAGYTFRSWIYWGIVEPARPEVLEPLARAAIAISGPGTLAAVAGGAFLATHLRPGHAAQNLLRLELGRFALTLALGVHPVASIALERGDLWALRTSLNAWHAPAGDAALLAIGVGAALAFWAFRRAGRLRARATPTWDADRAARARLAVAPDDPDALLAHGRAQLGAGDRGAIDTFARALAARPDDPHLALWLGRANLLHGLLEEASTHLRLAGRLVEASDDDDEPLLFAILFHLTEARLALGDPEGAVLTAEAARAARPEDPMALLLVADALVATGRAGEAEDRLRDALEGADARGRRAIERRLASLRRR
ncbi:MAG: hypothetical protein KF729_33305 [Sandaracinaceae bacterium]|nr:hypothetical protein [Sandaracinaceae bacterium]